METKPLPSPSLKFLLFPEWDREYEHFKDAKLHPFDPHAQAFSPVNAWWLAEAALLAYWDEEPARPIWCGPELRMTFKFLCQEGVQCHLAWRDDLVIVAFRGAQPDDWHDIFDMVRATHVHYEPCGNVHRGFLSSLDRIWPVLEHELRRLAANGRTVWFTGHSLGAAVATLAMDRYARTCGGTLGGLYTIGSPQVGDHGFARYFNERYAKRSFRYANHLDIVANLPKLLLWLFGGYLHVKERKYIDSAGNISDGSPTMSSGLASLRAWRVRRTVLADRNDAVSVEFLPALIDHTPRRYAVLIWNDYVRTLLGAAVGTI